MRRTRRWMAALAVVAVAAQTDTASAGQYDVFACAADRVRNSSQAFGEYVTRGMRIRRACNLEGPGLRGLVTGNVPRAGRIGRGARSIAVLRAPVGTVIKTVRWSGSDRRRDCAYAAEVYGAGPSGAKPIYIRRAGQNCPKPRRAQDSYNRRKTYDASGSTSLVQRLVCRGLRKRRWCSARGNNYVRTLVAQVTLEDTLAPAVAITGGGLASGRWVRGEQGVTFDAQDNIGIERERLVVAGQDVASNGRSCDAASTTPCPNGPGSLLLKTVGLPDGIHPLRVEVADRAGHTGVATSAAFLDNNAPERINAVVDGGDGWRRTNEFAIGWTSTPEAYAPIAAVHYQICRAGGHACRSGRQPTKDRLNGVSVPSAGAWEVSVWREDAAGNQDSRLASVPVPLRFDPDPPVLAFEPSPSDDPTILSAAAKDATSGVAAGQIEISREGSGSWQALETRLQADRLVARIDDEKLPPGRYLARVHATDQAGNHASTDRWTDGTQVVLNLPIRSVSSLTAGVLVQHGSRRRARTNGPRRRLTRRMSRATVRLGKAVTLAGRLTVAGGRPLSGARLTVIGDGDQSVGETHTAADGTYRFSIRAERSQVLRVIFAGSSVVLPASAEASLVVPAKTTFRVSRRSVLNGRSVRFRGRLQSLPAPAGGKLVELQVRLSRRWQTFRTTTTDAAGLWTTRYRFLRTVGIQRYAFRARLPSEVGYPFAAARSKHIVVQVRGR
jgi:hypothetical protein